AILAQGPDLVFLDVHMPKLDGFEVIQTVGAERMPAVVFVTAYDQHALRAFDVHAVDYVLKPVEQDRLREALARARTRHAQATAARRFHELQRLLDRVADQAGPDGGGEPAPATLQQGGRWTERILVRAQEKLFFVRTADVDWIEAAGNYVRLHAGSRAHLIRETMARMEQTLDPATFVRIHRSTIVNMDRVQQMEPWFSGEYLVHMADGTQLRMSRWYRDRVLNGLVRFPAEEPRGGAG
ncbi:MAG TPA: LytTR family DNA-binding domain-containing protein, partial [Longimicrobium sp.]|nr:LytTR family DNA-binding domain-containing protein [Longimicrobium sp.]